MNPEITGHYAILTSMLAPAILMTAAGSMLMSANNRLARVVDRLRILLKDWNENSRNHPALEVQIYRHRERSRFILRAILFLYCAMGFFIATSLALAADALLGSRYPALPTGFGVIGMLFMMGSSIYLGREVYASVKSFEAEIEQETR